MKERINNTIALINDEIEKLCWVNSTDEELKNVKTINLLKKILKELEGK